MGTAIQQLSENLLVVSLISLVVGSLITILVSKLSNKSGVLGYTTIWHRIGISTDDEIFGNVRLHWQGQQVRNLYVYSIEVENYSSSDYENIEFHCYSGDDTVILNESTQVVGAPSCVHWSPQFENQLKALEGGSEDQLKVYSHRREYLVPVFNRGQKLSFTFLCSKPHDDSDPGIFLSTPSKGVRLKRLRNPFVILRPMFGVPVPVAITRALGLSVVVVLLCGLLLDSVWLAALIAMIVGLFGQILGALQYRVERFIKHAITR